MNDICERWSLPWHVLQKNLASGIRAHENAEAEANRGIARGTARFRDVEAQHATASTASWLSRAQRRGASLPLR
jgi:hypothetical protein